MFGIAIGLIDILLTLARQSTVFHFETNEVMSNRFYLEDMVKAF